MDNCAFKLTEWTKTLLDKVKLKILSKRFRSKNNEKENGAPYGLNNKYGHYQQGTNSINAQLDPEPSQNDYPAFVLSQYEPVEQSTEQASNSTIVSPISFLYPNTDHSIQGSVNGGNDETPPEDGVVESDQIQSGYYDLTEPINDYSGVRGGPPHVLSQSISMPYLKQPRVMLTPAKASGDFHNMPDIIHQQQETSGKKSSDLCQLKCDSCGKSFKQKATLIQHKRIQTDSRLFVSSDYGKRFHQQSCITQHVRIHDNKKPFVCVHCERTFRQRETLNQHLRIHSGEKSYRCGYCDEVFRNKAVLKKHIRTQQDVVHDIFGQADKSIPDVIQHGRSAGANKELKQKSTLRQHGCVRIESRPYPCVECGKRFRQQSHLTQHLRIHTNEKPFKCIYCERNFRQQAILNQHLRIHTGEKPYKCLQCGKNFRQKVILDQHIRTHQG